MIEGDRLVMFVIYDHPKDFPDEFVCRRCWIEAGRIIFDPDLFASGPTLGAVREKVPAGTVRIDRSPGDDPVIVETWL